MKKTTQTANPEALASKPIAQSETVPYTLDLSPIFLRQLQGFALVADRSTREFVLDLLVDGLQVLRGDNLMIGGGTPEEKAFDAITATRRAARGEEADA